MVTPEQQALAQLKREVADLRGQLAVLKSALNLNPDETWASMAGRIRRQSDETRETADEAMENIPLLYENTVIAQSGRDWQPLAMPPGATGSAGFRPASDGSLALHVALSWRSAPGAVLLSGVEQDLWPNRAWTNGEVSVAVNGLITLNVAGTRFAASVLVPIK